MQGFTTETRRTNPISDQVIDAAIERLSAGLLINSAFTPYYTAESCADPAVRAVSVTSVSPW